MGKKSKELDELRDQYSLLINARNFHYDNFNKWLTYFYVANGALFIGYLQVLTSKIEIDTTPILLVGFLAGLLLYWSSKGYYYWNINFILLVNNYEKRILRLKKGNRIYSVFANKNVQNKYWSPISGANYSTSKIAIMFAFIICVAWGCLLLDKLDVSLSGRLLKLPNEVNHCIDSSILVIVLSAITPLMKIGSEKITSKRKTCWFLASNTDPLDDLKLKQ
ncbi:RipA family octameric membrane protein [Reichenbachiella versicolor]|uniref:RipA family octameric membrane protein n=1 Tax=Reichenbachiella versicolor TaxID=1821036 RepID=UPI000D6E900B|nr:hypothetical protein [Reichenbachiella versicolor]